jgi:DNA-binding CsgD family transcriptional regulator
MWLKRQHFQQWGAIGGRIRAKRLLKARRHEIAREAAKIRYSRPSAKREKKDDRILTMKKLYRSGKTLEEIGNEFGLTRERVRQLMQMKAKDGGKSVRSLLVQKEKAEHKKIEGERSSHRVYGCSAKIVETIQGALSKTTYGSPCVTYIQHKKAAFDKATEWQFTLETWWRIWQGSGKWPLRGRGRDRYCMARIGDTGPYSPDNVHIITNAENSAESYDKHPSQARMAHAIRSYPLTRRQCEIWNFRERGLSVSEIAEKVGLKNGTVAVHLNNIKHKLGML